MTTMNDRIAELIQADVDGELSEPERAGLEAVLAQNPDARVFHEEMLRVAKLLADTPEVDPPANMRERILDSIKLPSGSNILQGSASWFRPASYGLAIAAGVLIAVGVQRVTPKEQPNLSNLVGSMVQKGQALKQSPASELAIDQAAVHGQIRLKNIDQAWVIEFSLQSEDEIEIEVDLSGSGLRFGGFAQHDGGIENFQVSEGKVRMMNQGDHQFVLFLQNLPQGDAGVSQEIGVEVNHRGTMIYRGLLESRG